ncbi:ABC transporter permease [Streptomyces sp. CA-111067]|uniref:ABC transporter permease n=1 Tax=Streptomyces sp. CA-111067 TaxID=3240046 RepID=UPI003D95FA08
MSYLQRKIAFYLVAVVAALGLNFFIPRLIPGNPVDAILAKTQNQAPVPPSARHALELQFGVSNEPLWRQFAGYLSNLAHGNWGLSVTYYPTPVTEVIKQALPWTLVLVGAATTLSFLLGTAAGAVAGWKRGSWIDNVIPATTFTATIPYFWLALLFLYGLAQVLPVFPLNGGYDPALVPGWSGSFLSSAVYHSVLPALTIVVASFGGWLLGMRNMMVSTVAEEFVLTAEAKGMRPRSIMIGYAARNAMLPSVAGFAISLGFVVSGSVITETVFSYPGIGNNLVQAVQNDDYPLMQGIFLVITLSVLGTNFLVDVLYAFIDPRTRQRS